MMYSCNDRAWNRFFGHFTSRLLEDIQMDRIMSFTMYAWCSHSEPKMLHMAECYYKIKPFLIEFVGGSLMVA